MLPKLLATTARAFGTPHVHGLLCAARRSDRAAERDLWTCSARVACNAERAEMGGMMHCGGEAQIAAQGTACKVQAPPVGRVACLAILLFCTLSVRRELEKFRTLRIMPLLTCVLL